MSPMRSLRIITYNVRYFGHALRGLASTLGPKRRIAAALLSLDPLPDIVCLQEVETISLRSRVAHKHAHDAETQLEAFMGRLEAAFEMAKLDCPYEGFYFRAHAYRLGQTPIYTTGLAVLVNRNTVTVEGHNCDSPQHITHHHLSRWKDRKQSRICGHVRLVAAGQPLHIFNTHLSLPTPWSKGFWSQKDKMGHGVNQLHEAKSLAEFVHRHANGQPFIVCGDFNSPPGSPVFRYLVEQAKFTAPQVELKQCDPSQPRLFPTAGFMRLRMHLDHLFSGGVRWLDLADTCAYGDTSSKFYGLSDHMPLIGRFSLEP
jgi:endonuclease/exonuclease/phosphatase family metal-dependent hydrolase